ncbi:Hypothetical protein A7982_03824 [Minicystis rosea]|nr:Hypothetical protein A7982_03824 [Minicystis rosea]
MSTRGSRARQRRSACKDRIHGHALASDGSCAHRRSSRGGEMGYSLSLKGM